VLPEPEETVVSLTVPMLPKAGTWEDSDVARGDDSVDTEILTLGKKGTAELGAVTPELVKAGNDEFVTLTCGTAVGSEVVRVWNTDEVVMMVVSRVKVVLV
jgi:hypothetical protein